MLNLRYFFEGMRSDTSVNAFRISHLRRSVQAPTGISYRVPLPARSVMITAATMISVDARTASPALAPYENHLLHSHENRLLYSHENHLLYSHENRLLYSHENRLLHSQLRQNDRLRYDFFCNMGTVQPVQRFAGLPSRTRNREQAAASMRSVSEPFLVVK